MAKVIPILDDARLSKVKSDGEKKVYRKCLDLETNDLILFSLPWIRTNIVGEPRNGETDFVVFNNRGYLVIEVKGGQIKVDRSRDHWTSTDRNNVCHPMKQSPFKQASGYMFAVKEFLEENGPWNRSGNRPLFGHAVLFPDVDDVDIFLHTDVKKPMIGGRNAVRNLQEWLDGVFDYWSSEYSNNNPIDQAGMECLLKLFASTVEAKPLMRRTIAWEEQQRIELLEEQKRILRCLESNNRVLIRGGAGTGKTLLALHRAKNLAEAGKKVLLLCYNSPLNEHMKQWCEHEIAETALIEVRTFHSFCNLITQSIGTDWPKYRQQAFEADETGDRYKIATWAAIFASEDMRLNYDAIIVDEGQDFDSNWWLAIEPHLHTSDSSLYIFLDEKQRIYGATDAELPQGLFACDLVENVRNTQYIHSLAYSFLRDDIGITSHSKIHGHPVDYLEYDTLNNQADKIYHLIQRLINEEELDPSMIVVLTPSSGSGRYFNLLKDRPLPGNAEWSIKKINPEGVLLDTMARFKGLESMFVICWLSDKTNPAHIDDAKLLYTTCSRAVSRLAVCASKDVCELIKSFDNQTQEITY